MRSDEGTVGGPSGGGPTGPTGTTGTAETGAVPFGQRLFDRPFVLLGFGMFVMVVFFTLWGLWEIRSLPPAPLP